MVVVMNLENEQSENSAKITKIMQDNPDFSYEFVHQLLIAQTEIETGQVAPFKFG